MFPIWATKRRFKTGLDPTGSPTSIAAIMDFTTEKKSEASPTVTLEESKDVEYQHKHDQDESPAQPLLEV